MKSGNVNEIETFFHKEMYNTRVVLSWFSH